MVLSMSRWEGKVAIVTGASGGIGATIVQKLVENGINVVGIGRRLEEFNNLIKKVSGKKGKLHPVQADMINEEEILKAFKWVIDNLGPVHILINNAGIMPNSNLTEEKTEVWKSTFDINVIGLCIATREAVKIMKSNNIDGHIIHTNSLAGHLVPNLPGMGVYAASKYAVTALTETLRQEFNHLGNKIKVTSISPGAVDTGLLGANSFKIDPNLLAKMPLLQPEDIADTVIFTLSTPPRMQVHEIIVRPTGQKD